VAPDIDLTQRKLVDIDLTQPTDHAAIVIESGSFARAECPDCGWTGPARRSRAVAVADVEQHP
jgi:hypothetical protein